MRTGSLCSGYGGLDMAVGGDLQWVCDFDKGAARILAHRYPDVPNLHDLTAIDWTEVGVMAAPRNDALAEMMYDRYCQGPARDGVAYGGKSYSLGSTGYMRCTTGARELLHRLIWADINGPIPDGYDIHHRDHNKLNNDPANLQLLSKSDHAALHAALEEVVPLDSPTVDVLTAGYP